MEELLLLVVVVVFYFIFIISIFINFIIYNNNNDDIESGRCCSRKSVLVSLSTLWAGSGDTELFVSQSISQPSPLVQVDSTTLLSIIKS